MDIEHIKYSDELILVVDDEESIRGPVVEMLMYLGFPADSSDSGEEALRKLKKKSYAFLVTDIKMPKMDGLELIGRVKNDHPNVCVIAMTGYSKDYQYMDVVNAGASDFINKPFVIEELEAKIKRAIVERNIKQELNRLSITDSLTGLYNQRQFYARLKDDFKEYNDKNGHVAGDGVLKKVGAIISDNIRQGVDSGYRYGGDEFAAILIDASVDIAQSIAKRIEEGIQKECKLTASTGHADFSEGMTPEEFVTKADQHLYKFKKIPYKRSDNIYYVNFIVFPLYLD
ncbi:MAG: diguanylate cyclase [Deltaproteobacteria bacterium]|nr:diguanylate cyclase [Deltaproteobacteria bacterium]